MEEQSKALTVFNFEEQEIRTVVIDGEPWFVAADVCKVLEHSNVRVAVSRLDEDEKGVTNVYTLGGFQEMLCVNEAGLYHLIFTSRKAEAKTFRRKVTNEILPALRKTGVYDPAGQIPALQVQFSQTAQQLLEAIQQSDINMELFLNSIDEQIHAGSESLNPDNKLIQEVDLEDWIRVYTRQLKVFREMKDAKKMTTTQFQALQSLLKEGIRVNQSHLDHLKDHEPIADALWDKAYFSAQDAQKQLSTMQGQRETLIGIFQQFQQLLPPAQE